MRIQARFDPHIVFFVCLKSRKQDGDAAQWNLRIAQTGASINLEPLGVSRVSLHP